MSKSPTIDAIEQEVALAKARAASATTDRSERVQELASALAAAREMQQKAVEALDDPEERQRAAELARKIEWRQKMTQEVQRLEAAQAQAEREAAESAIAAERIAWENDPANTGWLEAHVDRYERHLAQEADRYLLLQEVWEEFIGSPCPPRHLWKVSDAQTKWSGTFWNISFQVTLDIVTADHMIYVQTLWPQTLGSGPASWSNISFMLERSTLHFVGEKFVNGGGILRKFEQMVRGEA